MIDLVSGDITFDDGLSITKDATTDDIAVLAGARKVSIANGRMQFSLGVHISNSQRWGVGLVFIGARLNQVWLQCLTCADETTLSLDNEKIRQRFHDRIVESFLRENVVVNKVGTSVEAVLGWGKISSVLDPRGVQALLITSYS